MFPLIASLVETIREFFLSFGVFGLLVWTMIKIVIITLPLIIAVAMFTLFERKVIGWMHVRQGPVFVGRIFGIGWIQPFADTFKLLFKEVITPSSANGVL